MNTASSGRPTRISISILFHFDGEVPPEEAEDFDVSEDLADMKVLDVEFEGLGDATYID